MSNPEYTPVATPNSGSFFRVVWSLLLTALICFLALGGWLMARHYQSQQQLNMAIRQIQVTGEPLDGSELNAYYRVPRDAKDLTDLYLRAIGPLMADPAALGKEAGSLPIVGTGQHPVPPPGQEWAELEATEQLLEKYASTLDLLHQAGRETGFVRYPLDASRGHSALLTHVQELRTAARLLSLEFQAKLHRGDMAGAAESLIAQVKLGETLQNEPVIISQLVRVAISAMATQNLETYLTYGTAEESQLKSLQEVFAEVDFQPSLKTALLGERALAYQTLSAENLQTMQGATRGGQPGASGLGMLGWGGKVTAARPGDSAMVLNALTEMIAAAEHPFPQAFQEEKAADARLQQFFANNQNALPWDRYVLTEMLLPSVSTLFNAAGDAAGRQESAVAALAIQRYRQAHPGKLPEKLDALVPDFLPALPRDPFDGQSLRLKLTDERYIVYSIGSNEQDDGGDVNSDTRRALDSGVQVGRQFPAEKQ